jgi:2-polyprenyl-3-methyl-5-hydroxy-6-metoxy-1,4-benzoquinol methylase
MTAAERWLAAVWPRVRAWLPVPPARVLEIGCGPQGGFVPQLRRSGYEVVGVDPEAPDEADYRRSTFEHVDLEGRFDAVVASTSLHHVADPAEVIGHASRMLAGSGTVVVIEWEWESFDEPTARWCFARLGPDEDAGWLHRLRDEWATSGQAWEAYLRAWVEQERIHSSAALLRLLDRTFDRQHLSHEAYVFPDLAGTSEEDELAAIEAGKIRATRVDYVGRVRI